MKKITILFFLFLLHSLNAPSYVRAEQILEKDGLQIVEKDGLFHFENVPQFSDNLIGFIEIERMIHPQSKQQVAFKMKLPNGNFKLYDNEGGYFPCEKGTYGKEDIHEGYEDIQFPSLAGPVDYKGVGEPFNSKSQLNNFFLVKSPDIYGNYKFIDGDGAFLPETSQGFNYYKIFYSENNKKVHEQDYKELDLLLIGEDVGNVCTEPPYASCPLYGENKRMLYKYKLINLRDYSVINIKKNLLWHEEFNEAGSYDKYFPRILRGLYHGEYVINDAIFPCVAQKALATGYLYAASFYDNVYFLNSNGEYKRFDDFAYEVKKEKTCLFQNSPYTSLYAYEHFMENPMGYLSQHSLNIINDLSFLPAKELYPYKNKLWLTVLFIPSYRLKTLALMSIVLSTFLVRGEQVYNSFSH